MKQIIDYDGLTIEEKNKAISEEFKKHKFRNGERYDNFLNRMLIKYNQTCEDYYSNEVQK